MQRYLERKDSLYQVLEGRWDARLTYPLELNPGMLPEHCEQMSDASWQRVLDALRAKLDRPRRILPYIEAVMRAELERAAEIERRRQSPIPRSQVRATADYEPPRVIVPEGPALTSEPEGSWLDEIDVG